jgi:predicted acylesterase/phospholipase RssA
MATSSASATELRIALVLNGGVSLAIWIGGVIHEIDCLRRAEADTEDAAAASYWRALTETNHSGARVDVIAGASAGGINGALLAAAIQGSEPSAPQPLVGTDDECLRETWSKLGDLDRLARSRREVDPPSLLRGDEYIVPKLTEVLEHLLPTTPKRRTDAPLYLYLTATDLRLGREVRFQTSATPITERDHRVIFRFVGNPIAGLDDLPEAPEKPEMLGTSLPLNRDNARRLARAARASSSFPGAFPPHEATLDGEPEVDGRPVAHHLVDGGILDNQPFDPVLDRISVMPADGRSSRIVLYVVPYVTAADDQHGAGARNRPPKTSSPGLVEVIRSSSLTRDLPKLESLRRVERDRTAGSIAAMHRRAVGNHGERVCDAAPLLFDLYREVQRQELSQRVAEWWVSPETRGSGAFGGDERDADAYATAREVPEGDLRFEPLLPASDWCAASRRWLSPEEDRPWCWGFTKAERISHGILVERALQQPGDRAERVRSAATNLAIATRVALRARRSEYNRIVRLAIADESARALEEDRAPQPFSFDAACDAFVASHQVCRARLVTVDDALSALVDELRLALDMPSREAVFAELFAAEVVSNAAGTRSPAPPQFDFYRVSAQPPATGGGTRVEPTAVHSAKTPQAKLAGMDLGHFAAFLKESWRANDWMWGRLDAVSWLGTALYDDEQAELRQAWVRGRQLQILREELPALADAAENDEKRGFSSTCDVSRWRRQKATHMKAIEGMTRRFDAEPAPAVADADADLLIDTFTAWQRDPRSIEEEAGSRAGVSTATQLAAVAARAFSGTASGLPGPVRGAVAAARGATSATNSLSVTFTRAPALGVAFVIALSALAVLLATRGAGVAALVSPALIALAMVGAWATYGWLSSPPAWWRVATLGVLGAGVCATSRLVEHPAGWNSGGPTTGWAIVWWVTALATVAVAVGWFGYVGCTVWCTRAARVRAWRALRLVRTGFGLALLVLLAMTLMRTAWMHMAHLADDGENGIEGWFDDHRIVQIALVVLVVLALLAPIAELMADVVNVYRRRRRRRASKHD